MTSEEVTCRARDSQAWLSYNLEKRLHRGNRAAQVNEVLLYNSNGRKQRAQDAQEWNTVFIIQIPTYKHRPVTADKPSGKNPVNPNDFSGF